MKRYLMECIGTFFLTLTISLTGNPIAIGFMLMAMIYAGGHVSGAHCNPAVSLALFFENQLSRKSLLYYWLAQSIGACIALSFFMAITNNMFIPEMLPDASVLLAATMEALFTMVFCWVILNLVIGNCYEKSLLHGVIIGSTLMAIAFIGGLFNPALAVGSLVCNFFNGNVMPDAQSVVIYIVGPLVGSFMASFLFNHFRLHE